MTDGRRLRILAVLDNLDLGGVRKVVFPQRGGLDRSRFEPVLLTLGDDAAAAGPDAPADLPIVGVAYRPRYGYRLTDYLSDGFLMRAARRHGGPALDAIGRFSPHVLHLHTNPRDLGLGILAARRHAMALVFTDHLVRLGPGEYPRRVEVGLRAAYRRLYRSYDVISVGRTVAACNEDAGFLSPRRTHLLLENQVDLERFSSAAREPAEDPPEIVCVGRIHPVKGVDTLIRAFARLRADRPVRLALVGPDATGGEMHRLAAELVAPPLAVDFLGPRSDVPELLRHASIAVLPSRREGMPLALLEQMAAGLPVVVSDLPENLELVTDEVDGLVFPV